MMATQQTKRVELSCGNLEYLDVGEGSPLLLLHGVLVNSSNWDRVFAALSKHHRCIAPTLPLGAHTLSLNATIDLTPSGIANLLQEFMDALGLEQAIVVGNDTGGAYAQVLAAKYSDRVKALVLSSCDALDVFPPPQFSTLQKFIDAPFFTKLLALVFRIKPLLTSHWVLGLLSSKLTDQEIFEKYLKHFVQDKSVRREFKKVVRGLSPQYTQTAAAELARLNKPTLLLWAAEDKLFPVSLAERLNDLFSDSQLLLVENSLTYIQVDQPDLFVRHVLEFAENSPVTTEREMQCA